MDDADRISGAVDGPTGLPLLELRPGETRAFGIDVSGRMGADASITSVVISSSRLGRVEGSAALSIVSAAHEDREIEFVATASAPSGEVHRVTVWWLTSYGERLRGDIAVAVDP